MRHRLSASSFRLFAALIAVLLAAGVVIAPTAAAAGLASISGTVRAAVDGAPLAGATVEAFLTPNVTTPTATATTAGDGTYTLSGLAAGTYKVAFTANNGAYQDQWYWSAQTATDAQPLTLASGDSTPFIDGYLADATTSLTGTVYDFNSRPIQGVTVGMYSTGDPAHPVYTTLTGLNGTYTFTGIAPGTYLLRYTGDSDLFADDWYFNASSPAGAFPITINPGDHDTGYDQHLSDVTTSLSGAVYASDSVTPISGATVGLYATTNTTAAVATTVTAADGSYQFTGIAPGTYKLHFSADPSRYLPQWYFNSTDPEGAFAIDIGPGTHNSGWNVYLSDATTSLDGVVYAPDDVTPISGATVGLYSASDTNTPVATTATAADGSYHFAGMAPGTYKLHVSADPSRYLPQWYFNSTDPEGAFAIDIGPGTHNTGWNFQLSDATMSIGGNVFDQSFSAPLKGATVQLFASANPAAALATTTTAGDGSFLFPSLAAGNYLVEFTDAPLFSPQWYSFATDPGNATEIVLTPGQHPTAFGYLTPSADWDAPGTVAITGTAAVGSTLTAVPAGWSPTPTSYQYAWFIDGTQAAVGTGPTFTVTPAAASHTLTVAVTAVLAGFPTSSATSSVSIPQGTFSPGTPTVTGTTKVGGTLTASPGSWSPTPDRFTYQWTVTGSSSLPSTTSTTTIPDWALGQTITVAVTAHRYGYPDVTRNSVQTGAVTAGSLITGTPVITGTPTVGVPLSATPGTWGPSPALSYQWKSSGVAISGATGSTFTPTATQLGHPLTVTVTGAQSGYITAGTTSPATANVGLGTLSTTTPTITGSPVVGGTLTAVPGKWRPYPVVMSYQWYIGGVAFPGATAQTFVIPGSAAGQTITVAATGSETGYGSTTLTSAATTAVTGGALSGPTPTITGNPQVGATLTANPGTWAPAPVTLGYQWAAGGTNITGATSSTLVVPATALGKAITVAVTATKSGFANQTKTSAATIAVIPGVLTTSTPTISGSPFVGSILTAVPGSWGPGSVAFSYQWKANGSPIAAATGTTFAITAGQLGQTITVAVTGTETGYTTATVESAATATVTGSTFTTLGTPTIAGTAVVGGTLTAATGTWTPTPDSYTYQWKAGGAPIIGATASSYVVAASLVGQTITVTVTAHKTGYADASATSAATGAVAAGTLTAPIPTITGTAVVGGTLTAVPGSWGPGAVALTYQWKANGTNISDATAATFTITAAQLGQTVAVAVTGTETGYTTATKVSAATVPVGAGTLTASTPTISGTTAVGSTLTAVPGSWGPGTVALTYQWKANGTTISGATSATFTVAAAQLGQTITVAVTGTETGYSTATKESVPTAVVSAAAFTTLGTPTITGTPVVGGTLTAATGTWTPTPDSYTYQWKANGATITGANASTYLVATNLVGQTITVTVTAHKTGYADASATSAATGAVAAGTLTAPIPTITGTAVVGGTLTAVPGSWGPGAVALTYQWKANGTNISGATAATFTITAAQLGQTITVAVTGTETGYTSSTKMSAATVAVTQGVTGTISGRVVDTSGGPVTNVDVCLLLPGGGRDIGTLDNNGNYAFPNEAPGTYTLLFINSATLTCGSSPSITSAYWPQWYQWGNAAAQATPILTTLAQSSISLNTVTLTAMGSGTNGEEYNYSRPTITGTAVVGSTLTAHAGSWFPAPDSVTLQWKANGVAIAGATGSTYSPMATDSGKTITVTETASGQFVTTTTATSDATATVTGGTLTAPTPTITGTAKVGSVLTAGPGTWAPAPVALTYQWKANGANISGATANTYTVAASLVGETITVAVTGSKAGYTSTTRTSAPTAAVAAGALNAPTPTITGTAKVGSVLTAGPGTWAPAPVALTYQWKANGASISGATANTYTVAASLVGQTITVTVTGTKTGYTTTAKTSTATAAVVAGTLSAPTPTITGTAKVGSVLTAHPGTWAPSPVTLTYQWKANGANISGATGTTYAVVAGNVGKKISVTVNGTKTGYTTTAKTSTATAAVVAGTLTAPTPTITGTAKVGGVLTAHPGTWAPSPITLTYQWKANGANISGATHSTYSVAASLVGKKITVTVTGTKTGYTTTAKTSTATAAVAAGTLTAQIPSISGTAKVGKTLTANAGTWAPAPVTLTYQWRANGINIAGATGKTYVISSSLKGKKITVTVTGTKSGFTTVSKTSLSTATVS